MLNSVRPIRLLLQLLTADQFIGERDKVAIGRVSHVKPQGTCGRLMIVTENDESCVWRLPAAVVEAIVKLWSELTIIGLDSHSDSALDFLAASIVRNPSGATQCLWTTYDTTTTIVWSI